MAQLAIAATGAILGNTFGWGISALGMSGASVGWIAGGILGGFFTPTQRSQGPRLDDLKVTGTDYGQVIPWVAGSPRIIGQIVWASDKRETAHTEDVGKGGGAEVTNYTYDIDLLLVLTDNEIEGISRIWSNGTLVYSNGTSKSGSWNRLTIYNGSYTQMPDPTYEAVVGSANAPAYRGRACVFIEGLQVGNSGIIPNLSFEVYRSEPETLNEVLTKLMLYSSYNITDFDLYSNTNVVRGFSIGQVSPARSSAEIFKQAYFVDIVASDKIYFRQKATDIVVNIPYSHLGTSEGSDEEPLSITLSNEMELAAQVSIQYNNVLADYQSSAEHSDRLLSYQVSDSVLQLPLGLTPTEARTIADKMLVDQLAKLNKCTLRVPLLYSYLEPNDIITVENQEGTRQYRLKIDSKQDNHAVIELECSFDSGDFSSIETVSDQTYDSQTVVRDIEPTLCEILDIPALRDTDINLGYYSTSTGGGLITDIWPGAGLYQSWDDINYTKVADFTEEGVIGITTSILSDWQLNIVDETNTVTVDVGNSSLYSSTRDQVLSDPSINVCLIGNEILQFINAELIDTGIYRLSGLVRGRRGTEWATITHTEFDKVILLEPNTIRRSLNQTSQLGQVQYAKSVTYGFLISNVVSNSFVCNGVSLKPFSPANLRITKNSLDMHLSWVRRSKKEVKYVGSSGIIVPISEISENYRIKIYSDTMLIRTEDVNTNSFTYTSAMQLVDGVSSSDIVTFKICQLNDVVGEGYFSEIQGTI